LFGHYWRAKTLPSGAWQVGEGLGYLWWCSGGNRWPKVAVISATAANRTRERYAWVRARR